MIYIVVWSGGYEAPSYAAHRTEKEAWKQANDWWKDADEDSDSIDVIALNTESLSLKRLERPETEAVEGWFPPVDKNGDEIK